jgi:sulfite reductase (NADPH) hemoprotein beta-component
MMEERMQASEDEDLKARSLYLRGTIEESLADRATGAVSPEDAKLLKFHGTYQQDDRDLRNERQRQKLEPAYGFMVRVRMPGGVCTPRHGCNWTNWRAVTATVRCASRPARPSSSMGS